MTDISNLVLDESVVSDFLEDGGEYFLCGLLEGEEFNGRIWFVWRGTGLWWADRWGKVDSEPKKPADCFYFVASFFSFIPVFSIFG